MCKRRLPAFVVLSLVSAPALADPTVVSTDVIGPFSGHGAQLHRDNEHPVRIAYYGTDLGFTYVHRGDLKVLFGDSWAVETYAPIESATGSRFDDGFGSIDLEAWPDSAAFSATNIPTIRLGQHPDSADMSAIDPGHAMDLGKTPMAGFSNGDDEFALFNTTKPQGCVVDADCGGGFSCDSGLGYLGSKYSDEEILTLPCVDGAPFCAADTMVGESGAPIANSGFCVDTGSTVWADTPAGRIAAAALRQRVGLRDRTEPRLYETLYEWLTNRYVNVTATTVERFDFAESAPRGAQDLAPATDHGGLQRVFLWGRPGFVGVGKNGRSLGLYFAYADVPDGENPRWQLRYYSGSKDGVPQFSTREQDAAALDLDSTTPGIQARERDDIVHQMSVEWVAALGRWVMFYGGGITTLPSAPLPKCGVLQLFTHDECEAVDVGNGAIRMRTAENPWGPWSPPQDVIVGGYPDEPGSGQYGEYGVLNHPECTADTCAPHTRSPAYHEDEYGFFYGANIIAPWTRTVGDNNVEIFWNASTWDPYRVVLLRTVITK